MSDLIDRQNAIDVLEILADKMSDEGQTVMAQAVAVLKYLQSAEPGRKTGKWISVESNTVNGRCSVCGYESHLYENDVYGEHYCPNCGAWLRLE